MATARPAALENRYYQRTAGTARPCWICYKETIVVLSTINKADFIYVCAIHLADRNFATVLVAPPSPNAAAGGGQGPSKEEIGKVIAEYEAKEKRRKDKAKAAEKDDGSDEKGSKKDGEKKTDAARALSPSAPGAYLTPSPAPTPTHAVFALHRDFFGLRVSELRKRDNAARAQAVSRELPKAPSTFPLQRPRPTGDGGAAV